MRSTARLPCCRRRPAMRRTSGTAGISTRVAATWLVRPTGPWSVCCSSSHRPTTTQPGLDRGRGPSGSSRSRDRQRTGPVRRATGRRARPDVVRDHRLGPAEGGRVREAARLRAEGDRGEPPPGHRDPGLGDRAEAVRRSGTRVRGLRTGPDHRLTARGNARGHGRSHRLDQRRPEGRPRHRGRRLHARSGCARTRRLGAGTTRRCTG